MHDYYRICGVVCVKRVLNAKILLLNMLRGNMTTKEQAVSKALELLKEGGIEPTIHKLYGSTDYFIRLRGYSG